MIFVFVFFVVVYFDEIINYILYFILGDDMNYLIWLEVILIINMISMILLCWMGRLFGIIIKKMIKKCLILLFFLLFLCVIGFIWLWCMICLLCWLKFMWMGYWWNKSLWVEIFYKIGVILLVLEDIFMKGFIYLD